MSVNLKVAVVTLTELLRATTNSDVLYLALIRAQDRCTGMGVSLTDFNYVLDVILKEWGKQQKDNPMFKMFGI